MPSSRRLASGSDPSACRVRDGNRLKFSSYKAGFRDVKFEPTGTAPGPRRALAGPNVRLLDSCEAQH